MSNQFSNFKNTIKEFLKLDEEIRSLSRAKSDRLRIREKLSKEITGYYKQNNIHSLDLNLDEGKQQLELVESTRHPSVNQKFLRQALAKYCNNDKIVDNMIEHILEEREQVSSVSFKLKRVIPSGKRPKNETDAMTLIKSTEKNKIQERFNKLAEYAIMKDGIEPMKQTKENNSLKIENFKEVIMVPLKENIQKENIQKENQNDKKELRSELRIEQKIKEVKVRTISIGREVEEEQIEYDSDYSDTTTVCTDNTYTTEYTDGNDDNNEEEVDLDNIPTEETGYTEPPPQLDEPLDKKNSIKNIISKRLDTMEPEKFVGSIPTPQPQSQPIKDQTTILKDLELKALDSWKVLDTHSQKYPVLGKWLVIQKEKMKLLKSKEQMKPEQFTQMVNKIKLSEKEIEKIVFPDNINKIRMDILKYIQYRFK